MGRAGTVLVIGALVVAACSSGDESPETADDAPATRRPAESTTTAIDPASEEAAVLAAVEGYWDSYFVINDPPNPDHPDLARYRTGEALETTRANLQERKDLGQVVRLPEPSVWSRSTDIVSIVDDQARVAECVIDDSQLIDQGSGEVLNDSTLTVEFELDLVRDDNGWRVARNVTVSEQEGEFACE
jgi:hypothetical protein